jgi:hypothetical protein
MKIYIYLRRTEDWNRVRFDNLQPYGPERAVTEKVRDWWDRVCSVRWFKYRAEIKRIAMGSWKIPFLLTDWKDIFKVIEDEDILIPTDDDDWYHPEIGRLITENVGDAEFAQWNPIVMQTAFNCNFHEWFKCHKETPSCGYLVRGSVLRRMTDYNRHMTLIDHTTAMRNCVESKATIKEWRDFHWSVYNWHFGSISAIGVSKGWEQELDRLFPKRQMPALPPKYEWFRPEYDQFKSFVESLTFKPDLLKMKLL